MELLCIDDTNNNLISGEIYVAKVVMGAKAGRWGGCVTLKSGATYNNIDKIFRTPDGNKIPDKCDYDMTEEVTDCLIATHTVRSKSWYTNAYLMCDQPNNKYLKNGEVYKVLKCVLPNKIDDDFYNENKGNGTLVKANLYHNGRLIIDGIDKKKFPFRYFRHLTKSEMRVLNIEELTDTYVPPVFDRKIDSLTDSEKKLLLTTKIINSYKKLDKDDKLGKIDIIDYVIKRDNLYSIERKDFDCIKDIKIEDFLKFNI